MFIFGTFQYFLMLYFLRHSVLYCFKLSPFQNWMSDLEIFTSLMAAIIHDFEQLLITLFQYFFNENGTIYFLRHSVLYCFQLSPFQNWMSDLEIFTSLMAAIIHDFDHTGTTNNFHINSGSGLATLYNDRAVLENHHVSAFFR